MRTILSQLTDKNWFAWEAELKSTLINDDLDFLIAGKTIVGTYELASKRSQSDDHNRHFSVSAIGSKPLTPPPDVTATALDTSALFRQDQAVRSIIMNNVSAQVQSRIPFHSQETARDVYLALQAICRPSCKYLIEGFMLYLQRAQRGKSVSQVESELTGLQNQITEVNPSERPHDSMKCALFTAYFSREEDRFLVPCTMMNMRDQVEWQELVTTFRRCEESQDHITDGTAERLNTPITKIMRSGTFKTSYASMSYSSPP